jgi:hypothetical protein
MESALTKLDRNRPYGEILGGTTIYIQDEREFDLHGNLIGDEPEPEPEPPAPISPIAKLSIVQLKQIMADHGEPYLNKQQAIDFITNKVAIRV